MAAKFNPVSSEVLHDALESAGFSRGTRGKEVVYTLVNHRLPSLSICVYTSAKVGASSVVSKGKDAIRSVLLYIDSEGNTRCVKKGKRVFRCGSTEGIVERMLERARDLYRLANYISTVPACKACGAPCYHDSGKCVAYCWKASKASKAS